MSQRQDPRAKPKTERFRCILCYDNPRHDGQCEFVGREEFLRRANGDEAVKA